jgi:hypothetical protein
MTSSVAVLAAVLALAGGARGQGREWRFTHDGARLLAGPWLAGAGEVTLSATQVASAATADEARALIAALGLAVSAEQAVEIAELGDPPEPEAHPLAGVVAALAARLAVLGHSLPCDSAQVTGELIARSVAGTLTDAEQAAKTDVALLYQMLMQRGIGDEEIARIAAALE